MGSWEYFWSISHGISDAIFAISNDCPVKQFWECILCHFPSNELKENYDSMLFEILNGWGVFKTASVREIRVTALDGACEIPIYLPAGFSVSKINYREHFTSTLVSHYWKVSHPSTWVMWLNHSKSSLCGHQNLYAPNPSFAGCDGFGAY